MRINELTISKQIQQVDADPMMGASAKLAKILSDHGWHRLGTGAEAAVAEHPDRKYVLKIFNSESKYEDFVHFVQNNPSNPHFPRFSRYVKLVPGTAFSYVRMEKLSTIRETALVEKYLNHLMVMTAMSEISHIRMLPYSLMDVVRMKLASKMHTLKDLRDPTRTAEVYAPWGGFPDQSWVDAVSDLAEHSEQQGIANWDMHAANFMLRGTTLVISDPYF